MKVAHFISKIVKDDSIMARIYGYRNGTIKIDSSSDNGSGIVDDNGFRQLGLDIIKATGCMGFVYYAEPCIAVLTESGYIILFDEKEVRFSHRLSKTDSFLVSYKDLLEKEPREISKMNSVLTERVFEYTMA